jgi:predicted Zn-dependent protease
MIKLNYLILKEGYKSMINFLVKIYLILMILTTESDGFKINPLSGNAEFRIISEAQEIEIGQAQFPVLIDEMGGEYTTFPELSAYVASIGQRLAAVSDRPNLPYQFVVVNSSVRNAMCLPGGKIIVTKGLLKSLKSESELAAVLAHEIGHANARHSAKRIERNLMGNFSIIGTDLIALMYDRSAEIEADTLSVKYMTKAGYTSQGAIDAQQMIADITEPPSFSNRFLSTHPHPLERLANLQECVSESPSIGGMKRTAFYKNMIQLFSAGVLAKY